MSELVLTQNDYLNFRNWLNLNLDGLTWQGRFKKEFEAFWETFFAENLTLRELMVRFEYAYSQVKIGSLSSWFIWLRDKFINYVFIYKDQSIKEIAEMTDMSAGEIATIIRNFMLDEYPHLDQVLNEKFQVGNILSPNINLKFNELKALMNLTAPIVGSSEDEIMPSMEVTLFDEWEIFTKKMRGDFSASNFSLAKIYERSNFLKQLKLFQDVAVLLLIFTISIYSIKQINVWYERNLANKVSIYEPQFTWLSKDKVFKAKEKAKTESFKLDFDGIKDISKSEDVADFFDPEKYEEESEVTLTTFDNIPRDLNQAVKEASAYEGDAENPNGYRDQFGGRTKVYRVMMTSTNAYDSRDQINELVKKYEGSPVGESRPGQDVPGGVYYNLYIPNKDLKEFMTKTLEVNQAKVFEGSTSNVKSVSGKTRVFIMVKSI